MLAFLAILAQRGTHEPAGDDGIGVGLILLGFLFAVLVGFAILTLFRRHAKKTGETGPDREPHKPGHAGRVGD